MNGYSRALAALLLTASGAGLGVIGGLALLTDTSFDAPDAVVSAVLLGIFSFAARMSFGQSPLTDVWDILRALWTRRPPEPPAGSV